MTVQQVNNAPVTPSTQKQSWHMPSLFLLLGSLAGIAMFGFSGLTTFILAIVTGMQVEGGQMISPLWNVGWVSLGLAALLVPGAIVGARNLRNPDGERPIRFNLALTTILAVLFLPLVFGLIGWLAFNTAIGQNILIPALQLLIIGLFAWVVYKTARHGVSGGTQVRRFGVHLFGVMLTPTIVLLIEMLVLIFLLIIFVVWAASQPAIVAQLQSMQDKLPELLDNEEALKQMLAPIINNPWTVFLLIAIVGGIMPLIEELFKPLAVWFMHFRGITEREGYLYGLISGLAFGVFESFGMMANPVHDAGAWALLVASRSITTLLHMATTALTGIAIGGVNKPGGWLRLLRNLLLATAIHAVWNTLGVLMGLKEFGADSRWIQTLGNGAPILLGLIFLLMCYILYSINLRLRVQQESETA